MADTPARVVPLSRARGWTSVEFSAGCVTDDAVPGLRDDFTKLAAALGVR
ncbi:hypothetical protein [Amycolatopsis sp. NPDC051061]